MTDVYKQQLTKSLRTWMNEIIISLKSCILRLEKLVHSSDLEKIQELEKHINEQDKIITLLEAQIESVEYMSK